MIPRKAVFMDRDGVLNECVYVNGISCPPANAKSMIICEGARKCVDDLAALGYLRICVTNQPDFSRGTRTRANIDSMNRKVAALLRLDDMFVCLHDNHHNCSCRKPKPGMLFAAAAKWNIDLHSSWMVGDRESDVRAGLAAGCRTIRISGADASSSAHYFCESISEVVKIIKENAD